MSPLGRYQSFALRLACYMLIVLGTVGAVPSAGDSPEDPDVPPGTVVVDRGRLKTCDEKSHKNDPCEYVVFAGKKGTPSDTADEQVMPLAAPSTNWYICGVKIYNNSNTHVGTLTNNTQATVDKYHFPGTWKLLTGYRQSWAATAYRWVNLTGPTPNPSWNTWFDFGDTKVTGRFGLIVANADWYAKNIFEQTLNTPTWRCRAGPGLG